MTVNLTILLARTVSVSPIVSSLHVTPKGSAFVEDGITQTNTATLDHIIFGQTKKIILLQVLLALAGALAGFTLATQKVEGC